MIRPATKLTLEFIGILVTAAAIGLGFLGWKLSSGPISLGVLTPTLEDALNAQLSGYTVRLDDTLLRWSHDEGALNLRIAGVKAYDADERLIVEIPEIDLGLSAPAIAEGVIAPTRIVLVGPSATIIRSRNGGVRLGFGEGDDATINDGTVEFVESLITSLSRRPDEAGPAGYLTEFGIRGSQLTYLDEPTLSYWTAPDARLSFIRDGEGISGALKADVVVGNGIWHVALAGIYDAEPQTINMEARFSNIVPADLADKAPMFAQVAGFEMPVHGTARMKWELDGTLLEAGIVADVGAGEITARALDEYPITLDSAHLDVVFDPATRNVDIKEITYQAGENKGALSGFAALTLDENLLWTDVRLDLNARDTVLSFPALLEVPLNVDEAHLRGAVDSSFTDIRIEELRIQSGKSRVELAGRVQDILSSPDVDLTGQLANLEIADLPAWWPIGVSQGARSWVAEHVTGGGIRNGTLTVKGRDGVFESSPTPNDAVRFAFDFDGLSVSYLDEMSPLHDVRGAAVLRGNDFDLKVASAWIDTGSVQKIDVSDGGFRTGDFHKKGSDGHIVAVLSGSTESILKLIDQEPLGFPGKFGLAPESVGGSGTVRMQLSLPLTKGVMLDDVRFAGAANLSGFELGGLFGGIVIESNDLAMQVNGGGLRTEGPVRLNGVPGQLVWTENFAPGDKPSSTYELEARLNTEDWSRLGFNLEHLIEGETDAKLLLWGSGLGLDDGRLNAVLDDAVLKETHIGWRKPVGVPATMTADLSFVEGGGATLSGLTITGDAIDIQGDIDIDGKGDIARANLPRVKWGPHTDLGVAMERLANGGLAVRAKGPSLDARAFFESLTARSSSEEAMAEMPPPVDPDGPPPPGLLLMGEFDQVVMHNDVALRAVDILYRDTSERVEEVRITGALPDVGGIQIKLREDGLGDRTLLVTSSDAGALIRGLNLYDSAYGGELIIKGDITKAAGEPSQLVGKVMARDFHIKNAPGLAKILTIGSLQTIGDLLDGEGIPFKGLELPIIADLDSLELKDGRLFGPALALTIDGILDLDAEQVDLAGTVVPSYGINSALGSVPILGPLLVGRPGEGLIGITYAVRGPSDKTRFIVNPISALAPGFLRRLFEMEAGPTTARRDKEKDKESTTE